MTDCQSGNFCDEISWHSKKKWPIGIQISTIRSLSLSIGIEWILPTEYTLPVVPLVTRFNDAECQCLELTKISFSD